MNKTVGVTPDGLPLNKIRVVVESNGELVTSFPEGAFREMKPTDVLIFTR